MTDSRFDDLVLPYLAGKLHGEEAERVRVYLQETAARRGAAKGVRAALQVDALVDELPDTQTSLVRLRERLDEMSSADSRAPSVARGWRGQCTRIPRGVWYTAAGIALCGLAFVFGWTASLANLRGHKPASASVYTTRNGQRANITLTDGTMVALDVASRLEVPADYPVGDHTLRLNGAALFTVVHHDRMPVTVIAGDATAQVLGTRFLVRHYPTDTTTVVAVHEGKVAVRSAVLTAGREADVNLTGAVRVQAADPAQFGFATGMLTLNGTLLPAAIVELDRWYDADIRLGDSSLATQRIAGDFAAGSLADLAVILEWTYHLRVVRDGRILTLYSK